MNRVLSYLLIFLFCIGVSAQEKVSLSSLFDEMSNMESIVEFPLYSSRMISSYDRRSVSPNEEGWFANDDYSGYLRYESNKGRQERVLFDEDGPGVVTAIRITTTNKLGTLRVYMDGEDDPLLVAPAYDLTKMGFNVGEDLVFRHSSYRYPVHEIGGTSSYVPIPFAKHLKITLEEVVPDNKNYYQVEYRIYPEGTEVESFSGKTLWAMEKPDLSQKSGEKDGARQHIKLQKGEKKNIHLPTGSNIVRHISLEGSVPRQVVISIAFDGKQTVWCPVCDFFGSGIGMPANDCRYMTCNGIDRADGYWPMPYKKNAVITLHNLSDEIVDVNLLVESDSYKWKSNSMYFHADWLFRKGSELCPDPVTPTNEIGKEETVFEAHGKGLYAGNLFSLYNYSRAWYGEGDEKIWIDGDSFPSYFGTGVEDYYNTSWAPVVLYHTLYGGALRADFPTSRGYNTFLRTRLLDVIPFKSHLKFDLEMLGWSDGSIDYGFTSFWYGMPGAESTVKPNPDALSAAAPESPAAPSEYRIENAIEFEDAIQINKTPRLQFSAQDMSAFCFGDWSKATQITCFGCDEGDYIEYSFPGYENDANYEIVFYGCKAADYAIMDVSVNREHACSIDCYDKEVRDTGPCAIGTFKPMDGIFTLRFTVAGRNPQARDGKLLMGLDCITIMKK